MRHTQTIVLCIPLFFAVNSPLSAAPSPACPAIMAASGLDIGVPSDYFAEVYRHVVGDGFELQRPEAVQNVIWNAVTGPTYRIAIEQVSATDRPDQPQVTSTLATLSCPVPHQWQATPLPRFSLINPASVRNEVITPLLHTFYARSGLLIWDEDYELSVSSRVDLALLWRYESQDAASVRAAVQTPTFAAGRVQVQQPLTLAVQRRSPVMALRLATSETETSAPRWSTLWHVASESIMRYWGEGEARHELVGPLERDLSFATKNRVQATATSISFSLLDRFDTQTQSLLSCENVAGLDNDCLAYNARVYRDVMQAIRDGAPVYVQLLIALDRGYVLQTYELAADADGPELIAQRYLRDTTEVRLPAHIFR